MRRATNWKVSVFALATLTGCLLQPATAMATTNDPPVSDAGPGAPVGSITLDSGSGSGILFRSDAAGLGELAVATDAATATRLTAPPPSGAYQSYMISDGLVTHATRSTGSTAYDWTDLQGNAVGTPWTLPVDTGSQRFSVLTATPRGLAYDLQSTDAGTGVTSDELYEQRTDGTDVDLGPLSTPFMSGWTATGSDIYYLEQGDDGITRLKRFSLDTPGAPTVVSGDGENVLTFAVAGDTVGYVTQDNKVVRITVSTATRTVRTLTFQAGEFFAGFSGISFAVTGTGSAWITQTCPDNGACSDPQVETAPADPAGSQAVLAEPLSCSYTCSLASDGSRFFTVRAGDAAAGGLLAFSAGDTSGALLVANGHQPLTVQEVALSAGRVVFADNRTASGTLVTRPFSGTDGSSLGAEATVGAAAYSNAPFGQLPALTSSGSRVASVQTDRGAPGGNLFIEGPGGELDLGPALSAKISGLRVLYTTSYSGTAKLSDLSTGITTALPAGGYDLWGPYFAQLRSDGSVIRKDLRTGAVTTVFTANSAYAWTVYGSAAVSVWGDSVLRSNADSAQIVNLTTHSVTALPGWSNADACDGGWPYQLGDGIALSTHCDIVRVEKTDGSGSLGLPAYYKAQVDGTRVIYRAEDGRAYMHDTGSPQHPRLLQAAAPAAATIAGSTVSWKAEFVFTHEIGTCTLTISSGTTVVKALPCTGNYGDGVATWDGTNTAGSPVPKGTYTWKVDATTPDASVLRSPDGASAVAAAGTLYVDSTNPTIKATALPLMSVAASATFNYAGSDPESGIASYDVRYQASTEKAGFGAYAYPAAWQGTTATHVGLALSVGRTYCFSTRAHDRAGRVSGWTANTCIARALDDRNLTTHGTWLRKSATGYYANTYTTSSTLNASLTRASVQLDRVAVVATKCSTCGTVGVYVGSTLVGKVSLVASTTRRQQIITLPRFTLRTATVTIKVLSANRTVPIDGLVITRI